MGEGRAKLPSDGDLAALGNLLITHEHGMELKDAEAVRRCYDYLAALRRRNVTGLRRVLQAPRPTPSKDKADG